MPTTTVNIDLRLRPHQLKMFNERKRMNVRVVHRRFGKTFLSVAELVVDALQTRRKRWTGYYLCPTYTQAKAVAWAYVKDFCGQIPGVVMNEQELKITMPNGASIQLLGAERYDALRGRYADSIVLDETAQIPSTAWTQVLSPMLADRKGKASFIGTPQGSMNLFYEVYDYATNSGDDEWKSTLLTYKDTGVIAESEIKRMQRTMDEAEFNQEMNCSFSAAIRGAFYAREMQALQDAGRVQKLMYDPTLPVTVAVDLGWSDAMVCIFSQEGPTDTRILHAEAFEQTTISDMVQHWREHPWPVDRVILPHDAKVHELATGKTRQQIFHSLGCSTVLAPNQSVHEGINQVRQLLKTTYMDTDGTKQLREALLSYRSEYDEVRRIHRKTPIHDFSSHWADSMRYLAIGNRNHMAQDAPRMRLRRGTNV